MEIFFPFYVRFCISSRFLFFFGRILRWSHVVVIVVFFPLFFSRLQMLEESLREVELRAQQQLSEEQRRNRELIVRVEREKQLEIENCTIKYVEKTAASVQQKSFESYLIDSRQRLIVPRQLWISSFGCSFKSLQAPGGGTRSGTDEGRMHSAPSSDRTASWWTIGPSAATMRGRNVPPGAFLRFSTFPIGF